MPSLAVIIRVDLEPKSLVPSVGQRNMECVVMGLVGVENLHQKPVEQRAQVPGADRKVGPSVAI